MQFKIGTAGAGVGRQRGGWIDVDCEVLGANNGMLMVTASGTAVVVE